KFNLNKDGQIQVSGTSKIKVDAELPSLSGKIDPKALLKSTESAVESLDLVANATLALAAPVSIDPALVTPLQATVSPVATLGLLSSCDNLEVSIPLKAGATIGKSPISFKIPKNAKLKFALKIEDGKIIADKTYAEIDPPLDGPAWFTLKRFTLKPDSKNPSELKLWPDIGGDGDLLEAKSAELIGEALAEAMGNSGALPSDVKVLVSQLEKLTEASNSPSGFKASDLFHTSDIKIQVKDAHLQGEQIHTLRATDTLENISREAGVNLAQLLAVNPELDRRLVQNIKVRESSSKAPSAPPPGRFSEIAAAWGMSVEELAKNNPHIAKTPLANRSELSPLSIVIPSILDLGKGNAVDIISARNVNIEGTLPNLKFDGDFMIRGITVQQAGATAFEGGRGKVHLSLKNDKSGFDFSLNGTVATKRIALIRENGDGIELGAGFAENLSFHATSSMVRDKNSALDIGNNASIEFSIGHFTGEIKQGWLSLLNQGNETSFVMQNQLFDGAFKFSQRSFDDQARIKYEGLRDNLLVS
ncbi:LysM peptidoglycan-binding domain-containing protein, partial [Myxococcota bacterium]|nr:LysM peptidoglycan-binding domain-containing protein [Myxococcota bacterium]